MRLETNSKSLSVVPGLGRRRHRRALVSVPFALRHLMPGGVRTSPGITLDLSEQGIGALVQCALRVGDTVEIDLGLPGHMLSIVAHRAPHIERELGVRVRGTVRGGAVADRERRIQ